MSACPTAILTVSTRDEPLRVVQDLVESAVTILRLFKVGAVGHLQYRLTVSDFARRTVGTIGTSKPFEGAEAYLIGDGEVRHLRRFWRSCITVVEQELSRGGGSSRTPAGIAYDYYCDALAKDRLVERRIANAVMGLESLLLRGETQEVSYRMRMRLAKLLSPAGCDPNETVEVAKVAYGVRSKFAHGSPLSAERKSKIWKGGTIHDLTRRVLDCLRRTILIQLLSGLPKGDLVALIDEALADGRRDRELSRVVGRLSELVS